MTVSIRWPPPLRSEQEFAGPIELRIVSAMERQRVKGHFAGKGRPLGFGKLPQGLFR